MLKDCLPLMGPWMKRWTMKPQCLLSGTLQIVKALLQGLYIPPSPSGLLPTMLREGGLSSASWRWGEGRWFTQSTQIEFLFIDCSAVLCTNFETSCKLVKCSATEVQPSPGTSFLLVNFPFLANHYHRKEGLLFCCWCLVLLQGNSVQFTRPICPSLPLPTAEEGLEIIAIWEERFYQLCLRTLSLLSFGLDQFSKENSCCLPLCPLINHKPLALSGEAAAPWTFEAGHLTPC